MLTTTNELYAYFRFGINKGNAGTVTPDEFDILYNGAAVDYVQQRCRMAERDQRVLDDLRALIPPPAVIINTGTPASEQEEFILPYVQAPTANQSHGYLHMLSAAFQVLSSNGKPAECRSADGWAVARIMRRDHRYDVKRDPFKRPTPVSPRYWMTGNLAMVMCGNGNYASQMRMEYVRHPLAISVNGGIDPDLPPSVNQQIADFAVRRYLENIESRRYGTFLQERKINS